MALLTQLITVRSNTCNSKKIVKYFEVVVNVCPTIALEKIYMFIRTKSKCTRNVLGCVGFEPITEKHHKASFRN